MNFGGGNAEQLITDKQSGVADMDIRWAIDDIWYGNTRDRSPPGMPKADNQQEAGMQSTRIGLTAIVLRLMEDVDRTQTFMITHPISERLLLRQHQISTQRTDMPSSSYTYDHYSLISLDLRIR